MEQEKIDSKFISLVMMLATACWQQIGKVANPITGKIEKELSHAQITIDLLVMLKDKTKGNLTSEEDRILNNTISDLQLNYADEITKETQTKIN